MFGKGDLNAARQLQEEFSQSQRPSRRGRAGMQQASGRRSTRNTQQIRTGRGTSTLSRSQSSYQAHSRGNHGVQVGRATASSSSRNASLQTGNPSGHRQAQFTEGNHPQGWWGALATSPSVGRDPTSDERLSQHSNMPRHTTLATVNTSGPSIALQTPLSDVTNRRSPAKRSASGGKGEDTKRPRTVTTVSGQQPAQMPQPTRVQQQIQITMQPEDDDLMDFSETYQSGNQVTATQTVNAVPTPSTAAFAVLQGIHPMPSDSGNYQEDVSMEDAGPSPATNNPRPVRDLAHSRWNTGNETPVDRSGRSERGRQEATASAGRTVASGISRGRGLGNSRWAS
ncbi:hypothetical protein DL764_001240 [Monosporascus ibericus]|uniref:Uncharacterized protein n=1 Tax=Monosporascus ibericus TaxID=155417 RepID=A0A4Q4TQE9_9PEZI|nr:hypothetical protein DL764_001240 [Monosporascus ibericus]